LFKNLEDLKLPENKQYAAMLEKVHFLPMNSTKMLEEYRPAEITTKDYSFVKSIDIFVFMIIHICLHNV
jgi:hypothetical protein